MDTPLEEAVKFTKLKLEKMQKLDPDYVFHCPKCGGYFENLGNYREMKMCGKCYTRIKTKEMEEHVKQIIGATIVSFKVEEADSLNILCPEEPVLTEVTIKTKDGKTIILNKPKEVRYIL